MSPESRNSSFPRFWSLVLCLTVLAALPIALAAQDVRITIPKRSKPTPVQKLNQDGVKAIKKHDYERAKRLFYKAYLIDPNDPFTLNNLGYVSELDGEIERAQRFYALAAEQPSEAAIAVASSPDVEGKSVADIAGNAADREMEINRDNVYAMGLLLKDRAPDADLTLQKALKLDPKNPFTLNNLGYAKEKEGELELALNYYTQAAKTGSKDPVVVTLNKNWRGKPISEIADKNAEKVRKIMDKVEDTDMQVARLNLRGVSAINRNERRLARQYFEQAYKLDPDNSFTLNNMGYLAETDGDRETAQFFYQKAIEAQRSENKVVSASRREMEGMRVGAVASVNDQTMEDAQQQALEARRRQGGSVSLLRRDNSTVAEPEVPVHPSTRETDAPVMIPREPGGGLPNTPAPKNPANEPVGEPSHEPIYPATSPNAQPPADQANPPSDVIEPLPDSQQPPNADRGTPPQTQNQQQPQQGQPVQGVVPPLPDNQQPPNADKGAPVQQPKTVPAQQPPPQK